MPLFDAYLIVDWSASSVPKRGADSIWYAEYRREGRQLVRHALANPATRAAATAEIAERLAELAGAGRRVLAGFDFPFGYPAGTARALGIEGAPWEGMWRILAEGVVDRDDNSNNRFELAGALNRRLSGGAFPFWGHPARRRYDHLTPRRGRPHRPGEPAERRLCERPVRRAQPVWKLAYTGGVGSQALTGIPRVRQIRHDTRLAGAVRVWPFETGLRNDRLSRIVLAEVYPSIFEPDRLDGLPKDAGQVTATARALAERDMDGRLGPMLAGEAILDEKTRKAVETEEAWILGIPEEVSA
jgi:precorrin-8X/cobalt-precorrin-8 methylmutase